MATKPKWNAHRGTWYVQYWEGGWKRKTVARPIGRWRKGDPEPTKIPPEAFAEAARLAGVEARARKGEGHGLPVVLREFLEEHIRTYHNPRTRETVEPIVRRFIDWCEGQGITRYEQVTRKVCKRYVAHLAETLSLNTVETQRGYIAAAWGRQVREEEIEKSPWKNVAAEGEDRAKPRKAWTPDQFNQLLPACDDWLRDILILGVHTGLRIRALTKIEWDHWERPQTDADRFGYIAVPAHLDKIGLGYKVPVSRQLNELLTRRFGKHDPTFIIAGQQGRPIGHRNHVGKSITRACRRAGLPRPQSPCHHMRRSFGRWAFKGQLIPGHPVPLYVVSRWLGHINPKTTLKYLDIEEQESAAFMVPDFGAPAVTPPPASDSATPPPATSPPSDSGCSGGAARPDA
jgi:integrase